MADKDLSNIQGKITTAKVLSDKGIGVGKNYSEIAPEMAADSAYAHMQQAEGKGDRLPPGQVLLRNRGEFPVLDLGIQPEFDPASYRFEVTGLVENPISWSWQDVLTKLPKVALTADFHCVTRWTQYDLQWAGLKYLDLEALVKPKPEAKFVIQYGADDYTTNVPLSELQHDNVILAYELWGKPIPKEHGWPLRPIIPHLYGWKASKFLFKLEYSDHDEPGFWEVRGYSNLGDPWVEDRYS